MKRITALFLIALMTLSLCSCKRVSVDNSSSDFSGESTYNTSYTSTDSSEFTTVTSTQNKADNTTQSKNGESREQNTETPLVSQKPSSPPIDLIHSVSPPLKTYLSAEYGVYSCYESLSAEQKRIYNIIDKAVNDMQTGMIELGKCSLQDMFVSVYSVHMDRPEYFWMPNAYMTRIENDTYYIAFEYSENKENVSYNFARQERDEMSEKLKSKVKEIKDKIPHNATQYEAELIVHDFVCKNVEYDNARMSKNNLTAYGALVDGVAVCEGYARAMQLILNQIGIPCRLVCGEAGEAHMWNLVKIGGKWHHLDATWDDMSKTDGLDIVLHGYFNISDQHIAKTHKVDTDWKNATDDILKSGAFNMSLPSCTSMDYFYANIENCILRDNDEQNIETLKSHFINAKQQKNKSCEFYIDSNEIAVDSQRMDMMLKKAIALVNAQNTDKIKGVKSVTDTETSKSVMFILK